MDIVVVRLRIMTILIGLGAVAVNGHTYFLTQSGGIGNLAAMIGFLIAAILHLATFFIPQKKVSSERKQKPD